jgi:hypothetical protein
MRRKHYYGPVVKFTVLKYIWLVGQWIVALKDILDLYRIPLINQGKIAAIFIHLLCKSKKSHQQ